MALSDLSLKWRLLIPILVLSFLGTTSLVLVAHRYQEVLVNQGERSLLQGHYHQFLQSLESLRMQASVLAWALARDPHVAELLAREDRQGLLHHLSSLFETLQQRVGLSQIHVHKPAGISFLRVHSPGLHGDLLSESRKELLEVFQGGQEAGGLVKGATGYSIRAVVPVDLAGSRLGTLEVGLSLEAALLRELKSKWGCDLTLHLPPGKEQTRGSVLASTLEAPEALSRVDFEKFAGSSEPFVMLPVPGKPHTSAVLGPIPDPSGDPAGLVEIRLSRTPVLSLMKQHLREMLILELVGLLAAAVLVWVVVQRFLRPIRAMVKAATEIASGERVHIPPGGRNELGELAKALRSMVGYLEASRERTRDYARNLEKEVERRTRELRASEERYRSLLERLPLVVYQMTESRVLKFSSNFSRQLLGMDPEELLKKPQGWDHLILPEDRDRVRGGFLEAVSRGEAWVQEYRLQSPEGRVLLVREQATPVKDEQGRTLRVEGILSDITLQRHLQEMSLQAEQLKTLGEISARLAHEIRNPLTSVGGLSRRILKELDEGHQARELAQAIVHEVQRLEAMLYMVLAYIQPVEVELSQGELQGILSNLLQDLAPEFQSRGMRLSWQIQEPVGLALLDPRAIRRALETLVRRPLFHMEENGVLDVSLFSEQARILLRLRYRAPSLGPDDLEHYFYPFLAQETPDPSLLDLPVARTILYRHGALVRVSRGASPGEVLLEVSLPQATRALNPVGTPPT